MVSLFSDFNFDNVRCGWPVIQPVQKFSILKMVLKFFDFGILWFSIEMLNTFERNITCSQGFSWHLNLLQIV